MTKIDASISRTLNVISENTSLMDPSKSLLNYATAMQLSVQLRWKPGLIIITHSLSFLTVNILSATTSIRENICQYTLKIHCIITT